MQALVVREQVLREQVVVLLLRLILLLPVARRVGRAAGTLGRTAGKVASWLGCCFFSSFSTVFNLYLLKKDLLFFPRFLGRLFFSFQPTSLGS